MLEVTNINDILKKKFPGSQEQQSNRNKTYKAKQTKTALEAPGNKVKLRLWLK